VRLRDREGITRHPEVISEPDWFLFANHPTGTRACGDFDGHIASILGSAVRYIWGACGEWELALWKLTAKSAPTASTQPAFGIRRSAGQARTIKMAIRD
jgi:hypothetical protein